MKTDQSVPEHLRSTLTMVQQAFPVLPAQAEYMALLSLLYEDLSDRNLSQVVSLAYGVDEGQAWNDVMRSVTTDKADAAVLIQVKNRLIGAGYESWLSES